MAWYDDLNQGVQQPSSRPGSVEELRSMMKAQQEQQPVEQPKEKNFWIDQISTAGGIIGGIGGSFLSPIVGTAAGAGAGSALGEAIENLIMGEKDVSKNVLKEGALGALFGAGPIKLAKGAVGGALSLAKGAGWSVAKQAASKAALTPLKQIIGKGVAQTVGKTLENKATTSLLKLTTGQTKKLLDQGIDPTDLAKIAARFGGSADDIIGTAGKSGPLQNTIRSLESGIQGVVKTAGSNVRIDASDIISALKKEAKIISKELGGGARLKQINKIIADAEKKYAKGVSVGNALTTLRAANAKFGASVLDDAGDAVATAAQKLEANSLREALKSRFPTIASGLDDQSKLINLREILSRTRAVEKTGKFTAGKINLTQPGTLLDPILNSRPVSRAILNRGAGQATATSSPMIGNSMGGIAARLGGVGAIRGLTNQGSQLQNNSSTIDINNPTTNMTTNADNMDSQYTETPQMSSPYPKEALMYDIQRDPKNASKYVDYYNQIGTIYGGVDTQKYSSVISGNISDFQSSLNELSNLSEAITSGKGSTDPILGRLRSMNPYDTEQQTLQAMIDKTRQIVGKALEGGVLRKEDEEKYKKILPTTSDTKEVAINKINMITAQLNAKMQNYSSLVGAGNTTASTLEDALMQSQSQSNYNNTGSY